MENVFVTGRGLITPLGNGLPENEKALYEGRSGIKKMPDFRELGLGSQVAGVADDDPECPLMDRKRQRFTSPNSKMAVAAAYEALQEAGLSLDDLKQHRVAIINGCAGSCHEEIYEGAKKFIDTGTLKRVTPFIVPRVMASSAVANLSLILGVTGETYDISSACASGAHAIMVSFRLLQAGLYDIVICGGSEELNWVHALGFNAIRAVSTKYNDTPEKASRPFDRDRDGFVIASGAGIMVLESENSMKKRGVNPIARISGVAANSNATDMVVPDVSSSASVMKSALDCAGLSQEDIDYVNTHGTATPTGDPVEMEAMRIVFEDRKVPMNSTKSMTGHMIGAAGAVEAIYCTMMMKKRFICPSLNLENPEPEFEWADFVVETRKDVKLRHVLTNSFGFGGTNASLVISDCNI